MKKISVDGKEFEVTINKSKQLSDAELSYGRIILTGWVTTKRSLQNNQPYYPVSSKGKAPAKETRICLLFQQ